MESDLQNKEEDLLTDIVQQLTAVKRKKLLPWWIKVFMWIFLVFGIFAPVGIIFALLGYGFQLGLYGLDTNQPLSIIGISVILLFLIKGVTSYGLLKETDWAIAIGIIDAIIGMAICVAMMLIPFLVPGSNLKFSFRLELLFLIPYLVRLLKIKSAWENTMQE